MGKYLRYVRELAEKPKLMCRMPVRAWHFKEVCYEKVLISLLMVMTVFTLSVAAQGSTESTQKAAAPAKTVTLKLSEVHAEGYPTSLADHEFARLVEEKTNGRVKIEVYTGGTLYGQETGSIEAMQAGDLAFARVSASPVASYVPALNAIQLPYLYKNSAHEWAVLDGTVGQKMLADIEASGSGLMGLCYYDSGCRSFYLNKPAHSVADLKGLKIRMQNNTMMIDMVTALGATGVTGIGPNDVYSAITQESSTVRRTTGRHTRTWVTTKRPSIISLTSTPESPRFCLVPSLR